MADTERLQWRKSAQCESSACVEVAYREGGVVLRDGKDPNGPQLTFAVGDWAVFLEWTRRCAK
jgi:hypothetical protein